MTIRDGAVPSHQGTRHTPASFLLLAGLCLCWGLNWPAIKLAVNEIPVLYFRTFCAEVTGPVLLLVARLQGERLGIPRAELKPLLLLSLLNITLWHIGSAYGVALLAAGRASIIGYTMPIWAVLLGYLLLGDRLTVRQLLGLALGVAGLAVLMAPDLATLRRLPPGMLVMLGAAMGWGLGTVGMKRVHWTLSVAQLAGWQLIFGGIPTTIAAILLEPFPDPAAVSMTALAAVLYATFIGMAFCQWAWFKLLDLLPAGIAAIGTLFIPVVGVFSSALILGEPIGLGEIVALVLVVLGIGLVLHPASP